MNNEIKKCYDVLGIKADASDQEVYDACGFTANIYKKYPNLATGKIQEINEAYERIMEHRKDKNHNLAEVVNSGNNDQKPTVKQNNAQEDYTANVEDQVPLDNKIKKCPFCAETIKFEAIKCRYCLSDLSPVKVANNFEVKQNKFEPQIPPIEVSQLTGKPKPAPRPITLQPQFYATPIENRVQDSPRESLHWNWKSFITATIMAVLLVAFASAALGVDSSKNILWTVAWIYLTIEAWKFWKWKALLPYPFSLIIYLIAGSLMASIGEYRTLSHLLVVVALNIGGLAIFYIFLKKAADGNNFII